MADETSNAVLKLCNGLPVVADDQQAAFDALLIWASGVAGLETAGVTATDLVRMLIQAQHLQQLAKRHDDIIAPILAGDGARIVADECAAISSPDLVIEDDASMMQAIRRLRQRTALCVALSDLAGKIDVASQMQWLSMAGETAAQAAVRYLFAMAAKRNQCPPQSPDLAGCGWTILALGKLGAGELNYSSDIDLIILHDPDNNPLFEPDKAQQFYVSQTRALVSLLGQVTGDGIGWRTDLRLRPDPGATAVSIQIGAALGYYESIARTWERAAFIRARPIAGDHALGAEFLADIHPFIWRRTLDYTVMDDMKSMLRRPPQAPGWRGYNIKSGANGIRQIEFFTHVLQLVTGGRVPAIRQSSTLPALQALAADEWITKAQATTLGTLYHGLRRVEHRLQMLADAQTHSLPRGEGEMAQFARFMGHADSADFLAALGAVMQAVGTHTSHKLLSDDLPDDVPDEAKPIGTQGGALAAVTLDNHEANVPLLDDKEALTSWLAAHGFSRPTDICATLDGWMAGRIAATRSERARALLNNLIPTILGHLTEADSPDDQFAAFAQFTEGLPASVQLFSMLDHNRQLTRLLCEILVLSPRMANHLRRHPRLFDLVLFEEFFDPLPDAEMLEQQLNDAIRGLDVEAALDEIKRRTSEWRFRAEVQTLSRVLHHSGLGVTLTAIADAVVRAVHRLTISDMQRRHGHIKGESVVIALGCQGIGTLTAQSDLDLVTVYSADEDAMSDGSPSIGAATYFARLTQTLVNWLSSFSAEGHLYEVDMRLRPDGDKASISVNINRFEDYYAEDAWIWEKLALAKARIITPTSEAPTLQPRLDKAVTAITCTPLDKSDVGKAIHDMRGRLRKTYGNAPPLQLRKMPGGLAELDLLVQGLRIVHADCFANSAQSPLAIIGQLLDAKRITIKQAAELTAASLIFSNLHNNLRLCVGSIEQSGSNIPPAVSRFLAEASNSADEAQLLGALEDERDNVSRLFESLFPPIPSGNISGDPAGDPNGDPNDMAPGAFPGR